MEATENTMNTTQESQENNTTDPGQENSTQPKSFDDLLQDKAYQAEFDRRISKALETAKDKWSQETQQQIQAARSEAEKLTKMSAEQRAQHEREQREATLASREQEISRRELRITALDELTARELPRELADVLDYKDADSCNASVIAVEKAFRVALESAVNQRLKGSPPKSGQGGEQGLESAMRTALGLNDK